MTAGSLLLLQKNLTTFHCGHTLNTRRKSQMKTSLATEPQSLKEELLNEMARYL